MNKKKSLPTKTRPNYRLYHALMEDLIADEMPMDKEFADKVKEQRGIAMIVMMMKSMMHVERASAGSNQGRSTKRRRSDSATSGLANLSSKADDQRLKEMTQDSEDTDNDSHSQDVQERENSANADLEGPAFNLV
ncbi:hypothetical protein Tco_0628769 [Tanacetum coccineum]|uniref:Uncharacterized protein n=1 Tax=Tanacetum coccineum TaxID=301880 RepID=A0ABQ4WRC8_9ASTR